MNYQLFDTKPSPELKLAFCRLNPEVWNASWQLNQNNLFVSIKNISSAKLRPFLQTSICEWAKWRRMPERNIQYVLDMHCNDVIMSVSNHLRLDCLLTRLFRHRSKKTPKLRVAGLCEGNSPAAGEFLAQRTSNAENLSIWWRYHGVWHDMKKVTDGLSLVTLCMKEWLWL